MKDNDDSIIDLRRLDSDDEESDSLKEVSESGDEFKISHMEESLLQAVSDEPSSVPSFEAANTESSSPASDKVRVKFDKFITLVATHTYEDVLEKNADEDVVISTNLLADLANAHEEAKGDKKIVLIFAVGITIGVVLAWLVFRT